ncbi:universal stress protein [Gudongella sp. DL1XJH-153]|uniref:universal stress protein n=1 Tax=Gudongella sp. DL1XJH-153 TaxID=3409804 RepID=UPI003BB663A1
MTKKILVPIDGSECSMKALKRAEELGRFYEAELTLVTVIDSGRFISVDFKQDMINSSIEAGQEVLQKATEALVDYPFGVKSTYRLGDIANEIITISEENNFDLIVMGSRGLGALTRVLLGGVSLKVVCHASCSVHVVK